MAHLDDHQLDLTDWEAAWAAYDETTYRAAFDLIEPDDVVLDIGAGDLRFARRAAQRARSVIAIERRADVLNDSRPDNVVVIRGDAVRIPFPAGVSVGVLLMRHCRHYAEFARKLRAVGCRKLITNARWGMAVELVALDTQLDFEAAAPGWYACGCGAVGFKACSPEQLTVAILARTTNVSTCPACRSD
jgi:hypothetical protein